MAQRGVHKALCGVSTGPLGEGTDFQKARCGIYGIPGHIQSSSVVFGNLGDLLVLQICSGTFWIVLGCIFLAIFGLKVVVLGVPYVGVQKEPGLLEVRQLVEVAVISALPGGDHFVQHRAGVELDTRRSHRSVLAWRRDWPDLGLA